MGKKLSEGITTRRGVLYNIYQYRTGTLKEWGLNDVHSLGLIACRLGQDTACIIYYSRCFQLKASEQPVSSLRNPWEK